MSTKILHVYTNYIRPCQKKARVRHYTTTPTLGEYGPLEKEIVREVVRGDKHNLRKSANCKAQISIMCGVNDTDLCVADKLAGHLDTGFLLRRTELSSS